jgi:hypothetical protein
MIAKTGSRLACRGTEVFTDPKSTLSGVSPRPEGRRPIDPPEGAALVYRPLRPNEAGSVPAEDPDGFGLIGALIDSGVTKGRASDAELRVAPLRDQTEDLDFREEFWNQLEPAIQAVEWPRITDMQTAEAWAPLAAADLKEANFVDLHTSFSLSPNSAVLRIHTNFSLYMKGSTTPAAVGSVSYSSRDVGKVTEGKYKEDEEAVALCTADDCAAYRAAVDEGIAETVKMLRIALPYAGGRDVSKRGSAAEFKYDLTHARGDFGLKSWRATLRGAVLERTDDRLMLQVQPGPIYSIPMAEAEEQKLR